MKRNRQRLLLLIVLLVLVLFAMIISIFTQRSVAPTNHQTKTGIPYDIFAATKSESDKRPDAVEYSQKLENFHRKISTKGALAKLTVKVVDSTGKKISGAVVGVNFIIFNDNGLENIVTGLTDNNGLFTAEKKTTWQSLIRVEKEGYYTSSADYLWNRNVTFDTVKDGRWQPWNPTIEVVLKEKLNPIKLTWKKVEIMFPKEKEVGFDIKQGELLPPFGGGKNADILFHYWSDYRYENRNSITNKMELKTKTGDGVVRLQHDHWSELKTIRQAPVDGYKPLSLELARTNDKIITDNSLKPGEYFVFKFSNDSSSIEKSLYGKIYSLEYGECYPHTNDCMVVIRYKINETPNDRNLEDAEIYPML